MAFINIGDKDFWVYNSVLRDNTLRIEYGNNGERTVFVKHEDIKKLTDTFFVINRVLDANKMYLLFYDEEFHKDNNRIELHFINKQLLNGCRVVETSGQTVYIFLRLLNYMAWLCKNESK